MVCGESDSLLFVSEKADSFLTAEKVPHNYETVPGNHDWNVWKYGLETFVQLIFK